MNKSLSTKTLVAIVVFAVFSIFNTPQARSTELVNTECTGFNILLPNDLEFSDDYNFFISPSTDLIFNYESQKITEDFDPIEVLTENCAILDIEISQDSDIAMLMAGNGIWVPYSLSDKALVAVAPRIPDKDSYTIICIAIPVSSPSTLIEIISSLRNNALGQNDATNIGRDDFFTALSNNDFQKASELYSLYGINDPDYEIGMLSQCLKTEDYDRGRIHLKRLEDNIPVISPVYYSLFHLYVSTCVDRLGLTVNADEAERFLRLYDTSTTKTKAHIRKEIAGTYRMFGMDEIALTVLEPIIDFKDGMSPMTYHASLIDLAELYEKGQYYSMAYRLYSDAADFYCENFGKTSDNYTYCLIKKAFVAKSVNQSALPIYFELDSIYRSLNMNSTVDYAINLDNIGSTYLHINEPQKALEYTQKAWKILQNSDAHPTDKAITLNNLANLTFKNDPAKAIELLQQSLGYDTVTTTLINLASFYEEIHKPDSAFHALTILRENFGDNFHYDFSNYYASVSDYDNYNQHIRLFVDEIRNMFASNVVSMTSAEREKYVSALQHTDMSTLFDVAATHPSVGLGDLCFDFLLMSKSLLVSFNDNIEEIVNKSHDQLVKDLYSTWRIARAGLQKGTSMPENVNAIETRLIDRVKKSGNFSEFIHHTWKDIQEKLSPKECVIEFYVNNSIPESPLYATLLPNDSSPTVIRMPVSAQDLKNSKRSSPQLAKRIMDALKPVLPSSIEKIYFSPAGGLHSYPIESYVSITDMRRLSSSRELLRKNEHNKIDLSVLYGGLDYDNAIDSATTNSIGIGPAVSNEKKRTLNRTPMFRKKYYLSMLPGSKAEVMEISALLNDRKIKNLVNLNSSGTETSFKSLSSLNPTIIHIATHGYYINSENTEFSSPAIQPNNFEDIAMLRSGLFFSGANKTLAGIADNNADDGILTAYEVSQLDLKSTHLVVLSACETGLGDITGDGVFGLQRGFKKAGVSSILMSLWTVDDEATRFLMSKFYEYLTAGHSKSESLSLARTDLKSLSSPIADYSDPTYWAPFILLDALD